MQTILYFVRHAHSIYTQDELKRPLSEQGLQDAKSVTKTLESQGINYVLSSPYKRAIQTVEGIAEFKGIEIETVAEFRERKLSETPVQNFSEAITKVWSNFQFSFVGGESSFKAQQRGVRATKEVLEKYKGKRVVIGTHGNIMALIMNYFNPKFDFEFWRQLQMPDIYELTFDDLQLTNVKRLIG